MRTLLIFGLLLLSFAASAQVVRGAGVVYTNGAPSHNPGSLGSPQAVDTITGYWYQYEYTNGVWRQAGFWLQPTGTAGIPSYTPAKQRQLFAINTGDSIYYYRSGQWRHLNQRPVAGDNIEVSGTTVSLDTIGLMRFKTDQTYSNGVGTLGWDNDYKTLAIGVTANLDLRVGQQEMYHVLNDTAATLSKGRVVRASGTTGNSGKIKANYFIADGNTHGRYVIGVVAEDITSGAEGYVIAFGLVRGINASGSPYGESWANGDILYANPSVLGGLTKVRPTSPQEEVVVAIVVSNSATVGSIFVRPQFPFDLGELGDVHITAPTNGQVLSYLNGTWVNGSGGSGIQYSDTTSLIATQYYVNSRGFLTLADTATLATKYFVGSQGFLTYADTSTIATKSYVGAQGFLTAEVDGSTTNEIQQLDTFAIAGRTISASLTNDGVPAKTLTIPSDTVTYLVQDSILSYQVDGVEFARDTISGLSGGGGGLSGGVADYLVQWTGATTVDTSGVIWTGGNLGVAQTSPTARVHVTGVGSTSATSSLVVENSAGTDKLVVKDDGAIEIGRNASGTTKETASITVTGSETNIGLALVTKGTGAITADIPDGTAAGGNARGDNAVDLQMARSANTQVASGQYSVIGGGVNNTASGIRNVVGGGESNAATGLQWTTIGGGQGNTASGQRATIAGGNANSAAGVYAAVAGGATNSASGQSSAIGGGESNTASAEYASVSGGGNTTAYLYGQRSNASGRFSANSDAQSSSLTLRRSITGESAAELFLDGASLRAIVALPAGATAGRVWNARIQLVAVVQTLGSGPDSIAIGSAFIGDYTVGIKRIGNTTSLVGSVQTIGTPQADSGMETSVVTITANDTNEALKIEFTPPDDAVAATVIRVVATVYLTEVGY